MKENLLLLRDSLVHGKTRFLSTWRVVSKNIYFDVLEDIIDKYDNTVHGA